MAIRLRKINNVWIALCAVESDLRPGDLYLDDGQDYALRVKFKKDYASEGIHEFELLRDKKTELLMSTQKVRDAEEVILEKLALSSHPRHPNKCRRD